MSSRCAIPYELDCYDSSSYIDGLIPESLPGMAWIWVIISSNHHTRVIDIASRPSRLQQMCISYGGVLGSTVLFGDAH